jgi:membrane dipeptidase
MIFIIFLTVTLVGVCVFLIVRPNAIFPMNKCSELQKGCLICIGYWDAAVCDISPEGIIKSLRYAIDLVGEDHVALGSDFDGTTTTALDTSELSILTQKMLDHGFSDSEITKVMGGNSVRFLSSYLPK